MNRKIICSAPAGQWANDDELNEKGTTLALLAVGCHFGLRFPGYQPSLAPWTGAPRGLSRTWVEHERLPMLSAPVYNYFKEKKREGPPSDFLWSLVAWGTRPGGKACEQARDLSANQRIRPSLLGSPSRSFIRTGADSGFLTNVRNPESLLMTKKARRVLYIPLKPKYGLNGAPSLRCRSSKLVIASLACRRQVSSSG
jgi:hypothetical protein